MSKFVPLAKDQHAKLRVIQSGDYTRFRQQNLIPVVVRDFFTLSAEFPLVFVTNESSEDFMPVAIMGLQEGMINQACSLFTLVPVSYLSSPEWVCRRTSGTGPRLLQRGGSSSSSSSSR